MDPLVELTSLNTNIQIDLIYYPEAICFVHKDITPALKEIQTELEEQNLGLKIWDGYRPLSMQWKLWNALPDERYVADPRKGGRHTRGTAVDVTLVHHHNKTELEMPTGFDDFSEKAWSHSLDATVEAKRNRALLHQVMQKHGFLNIETEWWHFDWHAWETYPVLTLELY